MLDIEGATLGTKYHPTREMFYCRVVSLSKQHIADIMAHKPYIAAGINCHGRLLRKNGEATA